MSGKARADTDKNLTSYINAETFLQVRNSPLFTYINAYSKR